MDDLVTNRVFPAPTISRAHRCCARSGQQDYRTPDHIGRLVLESVDLRCRRRDRRDPRQVRVRQVDVSAHPLGLVAPSEGRVELPRRPVPGPVQGIAMVFQSFALFPG